MLRHKEHENKLKDVMGRYRTQSLFREYQHMIKDGSGPLWTLRDIDPQGELPSLKRLYIECMDVTGYRCALAAFGSWKHWQKLLNIKWFREHLDEWNIELEVAIRSKGLQQIITEVDTGSKARFSAAKWLAEAGYKEARMGRPTKEDKDREASIASQLNEMTEEDAARIGLTLVNNGTDG